MSGDTLSDLLRGVRLRGAVFSYVEGRDPWVVESPASSQIIAAILPGVEHMMPFHGVSKGTAWASLVDGEPIQLDEGDLILFPHGDHHVMSSAPGMRAKSADPSVFFAPKPSQLPFSFRLTDQGMIADTEPREGHDQTRVLCGFLGFDSRPFNPLLASMPATLRVRGLAGGGTSWIANFLHSMVEESNRKRPGGEAVLERMTEMLFVEILRRYLDSLSPDLTGWLAGLRDPAVGRALALMHERPSEAWTLEQLGQEAGLSRSTLHERFVHFIGQPPMQYLSQWRIQLATKWLRDSDAKVVDVALEVGYESEAAFSRAFKRAVGQSPGAWRRESRTHAEGHAAVQTATT